MVKKLQAMADAKTDNQLASAVRESAHQIWLAGLGAFAKAQQEGSKVFEALVREGNVMHRRTRAATEERIGDVTGRVTKAAGQISKQATESWDKLEQVFEDRVARALTRLGVPSAREIQELTELLDRLNAKVEALGGAVAKTTRRPASKPAGKTGAASARPGVKQPGAKKSPAQPAPAKKAPAQKAPARKATAKKATARAAARTPNPAA